VWRNWQTQQTQNLPGITPREGSIPFTGTKNCIVLWRLAKILCGPGRKSFLQTNGQPCFNLVKRIRRCAPIREHCSDK
jgi:hypothetical protein